MSAFRRVVEIDDAQLRIKGNTDALEQAVLAAGHAMPFCGRPRSSDGQCRSVSPISVVQLPNDRNMNCRLAHCSKRLDRNSDRGGLGRWLAGRPAKP